MTVGLAAASLAGPGFDYERDWGLARVQEADSNRRNDIVSAL